MSKELSYINSDGNTVFTSHYHKARGTCCKSACIHCPFGFTLKKHGMTFTAADSADLVEKFLSENSSSFDWKAFTLENILIVKVKEQVCGILFKNHIVIKHLILKKQFEDQGLSKELVESYLFI